VLLSMDDVNTDPVDDYGWTPLHAAVHWGNMDAVKLLVEKGANVNASTLNRETIDDIVDPKVAEKLDKLKALSVSCEKIISHHIMSSLFGMITRIIRERNDFVKTEGINK